MTSSSIDTAACVAPPDPVLELDALARQLEATAARLEAQGSRPGSPVADGACGSSEVTAAVEQRSCAAAQTVRALRLGALTARHLRASSDELEALVGRERRPATHGLRAVVATDVGAAGDAPAE